MTSGGGGCKDLRPSSYHRAKNEQTTYEKCEVNKTRVSL